MSRHLLQDVAEVFHPHDRWHDQERTADIVFWTRSGAPPGRKSVAGLKENAPELGSRKDQQ